MDSVGVRDLQQRASAALRRVERGERLGITDRGRLVAILVPPSDALDRGLVPRHFSLSEAGRRRTRVGCPTSLAH
ncbi:MAG: type II toxin-antitoxin system prevent-host-death family antitoxin [Actinomycetota bacterium]|nr:type II toxin-antitoxin system prevent-host-death family antitoxin [Actinomycetota bacterium]